MNGHWENEQRLVERWLPSEIDFKYWLVDYATKLEAERDETAKALEKLAGACHQADVNGELSEFVSGELVISALTLVAKIKNELVAVSVELGEENGERDHV